MKRLHLDIETYSPEPIAKTGLYKYAFHPDFRILLHGEDGEPKEYTLAQILPLQFDLKEYENAE